MPQPDSAPGGGGDGTSAPSALTGMLPFFLILIVVMLFAPLFSKKDKHRRKRMKELKKHDEIVTSGGVYGSIVSIDEHTAVLQIAKETRIKVRRTSIFDLASSQAASDQAATAPAKGKKADAKGKNADAKA